MEHWESVSILFLSLHIKFICLISSSTIRSFHLLCTFSSSPTYWILTNHFIFLLPSSSLHHSQFSHLSHHHFCSFISSPPCCSSGTHIPFQILQGPQCGAVKAAASPRTTPSLLAERGAAEGQHAYSSPYMYKATPEKVGIIWNMENGNNKMKGSYKELTFKVNVRIARYQDISCWVFFPSHFHLIHFHLSTSIFYFRVQYIWRKKSKDVKILLLYDVTISSHITYTKLSGTEDTKQWSNQVCANLPINTSLGVQRYRVIVLLKIFQHFCFSLSFFWGQVRIVGSITIFFPLP